MSKAEIMSLKTEIASLKDAIGELKGSIIEEIRSSMTIIKKDKPATKKTNKVKVVAGAGAPDEEEKPKKKTVSEMTPLEKAERNVENWKKRLATNKPAFKDDKAREALEEKLKLEEATVRKLKDGPKTDEKEIVVLTIEELQALDDLDESDTPGHYWDAENGRTVTGPKPDPTAEMKEMKFEGETYSVEELTFAIHQGASKNSFKGYAGVGKFKGMCSDSDDE